MIRKVLASAVANAQHNDGQDPDELYVAACFADEGPTLKRFRPRARGRATRVRKRTCHITVIVARMSERPARARPPQGGAPARQPAAAAASARRRRRVPSRARGPQPPGRRRRRRRKARRADDDRRRARSTRPSPPSEVDEVESRPSVEAEEADR